MDARSFQKISSGMRRSGCAAVLRRCHNRKMLDAITQDVLYALRTLRSSPGFAAVTPLPGAGNRGRHHHLQPDGFRPTQAAAGQPSRPPAPSHRPSEAGPFPKQSAGAAEKRWALGSSKLTEPTDSKPQEMGSYRRFSPRSFAPSILLRSWMFVTIPHALPKSDCNGCGGPVHGSLPETLKRFMLKDVAFSGVRYIQISKI
jgi:hypothetical protein